LSVVALIKFYFKLIICITIPEEPDFVFIDADKSNYDCYYEQALQLVRSGGIIAIDNVFWSGRVATADSNDNRTKIIRSLNAKIQQDERVNISIIPIGDGLTLAMKK
jgi:predicted O-methyltransferase YrrM